MKRKISSFVLIVSIFLGISIFGITSAQAEMRSINIASPKSPGAVKPDFVPPVDGGSPSKSLARELCTAVQFISGYVDILEKVGNVIKWVKIAVYSSTIVCSIVYLPVLLP